MTATMARMRLLVSALMVALAGSAHADLAFQLTPEIATVAPGGTLSYIGDLSNTGQGTVFLNGDVVLLQGLGLTVDDSAFFANAPLSLSAGQYYSGTFFTVSVDATSAPGGYTGSFTIQGGATASDFSDVASQQFEVTVPAVPEPSSVVLMLTALAFVAGWSAFSVARY